MQERHIQASGVPGDSLALPCAYCADDADEAAGTDRWPPERLVHLYLCRELSTRRIAALTGLDRQRVTRALHRAGVPLPPRGAGRFRPLRRPDDPPGLPQLIAELYEVARLSSRQIAAVTGLPERTVRDRLRRYGIPARSRGRCNREDRKTVPAETLRDLYEQLGMTADEVGKLIGTSRTTVLRSAHALGIPVRTGGAAIPLSGPEEIELVKALYEDDLIASVLDAHDIPRIAPGGPIWERFRASSAERPARQGPLLVLRGRAESHRAAHRAAGRNRTRVHAPRGHPDPPSGRADPVPPALAHEAGTGPRYARRPSGDHGQPRTTCRANRAAGAARHDRAERTITASDAIGQQSSQDRQVPSAAPPRMADPASWTVAAFATTSFMPGH